MPRTLGQMPAECDVTGVSAYVVSDDGRGVHRPCGRVSEGYNNGLYLCQRILLLWREIYVSEEQGVVLEEDKIREHSFSQGAPVCLALALGVGRVKRVVTL